MLKPQHILQSGFTLIELLIVIAVLGVIASATLAAIDPIDKINAGNDARVKSDVSQVVRGIQAYVTANGSIPADLAAATIGSEVKALPVSPYTITCNSGAVEYGGYCYRITGTPPTEYSFYGQVKSKKSISESVAGSSGIYFFRYDSATGKACVVRNQSSNC